MTYEKAKAEVVQFDSLAGFMARSTTTTEYFTCEGYTEGEYCGYISWDSGITCSGYSQRNCPEVSGPDPVYILVCNHF